MSAFVKFVTSGISKAVGLTVNVANEATRYEVVILRKSAGGDLKVEEDQLIHDQERLKSWLAEHAAGLPVMWGVEGKQVLVKVVTAGESPDFDTIFHSVLSNAQPEEFVLNAYSEGTKHYCSLIRREAFDAIREDLLALGLNLYKGFVGPATLLPIREHVVEDRSGSEYALGNYRISESEGGVGNITRKPVAEEEAITNKLGLHPQFLNAFSYASVFFTRADEALVMSEDSSSVSLPVEFANKRIHKPFLYLAAGVLLVAFLANAWLFVNLSRENENLKEKSSSTRILVDNFEKRNKVYQDKNKIVEALNYNNTNLAWISDRIGAVIPDNISLTDLQIDPVAKRKQNNSPFELQKIIIKGNSRDNRSFGELVSAVSRLTFVDEIDHQSYKYNRKTSNGEFEIRFSYQTDGQ